MNIPRLTILSATTTTIACVDPLIGEWNGNQICAEYAGANNCIDIPAEYGGTSSSLSLVIEDDLTGDLIQTLSYGDEEEVYSYAATAENKGGGAYDIDVKADGGNITLDCSLTGKKLDCNYTIEDNMGSYHFSKE